MKIAILGTGANGAGIGSDMISAGHDVTFIDQWPANVEAIRAHGVRVTEPAGDHTVPVARALNLYEVAALRDRFDLVFLITKAYDAGWAAKLIAPYLTEDGLIVGVQNGMTFAAIAAAVGPERTLGAVIELGAAMFEPGLVERHTATGKGWFAIGSTGEVSRERVERAAEVLRAAGTVEVVDDILRTKWMKLVVNAAELVTSALLDVPLPRMHEIPGMHDFALEAGREAIRAGIAGGYPPKAIIGLTEADTADPDAYVAKMLDTVIHTYSLPTTKTTVLHDWMKGRHAEYDEINGEVSRLGAAHGVPTPANDRIVELARRVEAGELQRGLAVAELMTVAAAR